MNSQPSVITLLTDFGASDTYAGQVKGAILAICPQAQLVDLTHDIAPGQIAVAAQIWADAVAVFPPGTVHLGVVDPEVGGNRRPVAAEVGPWRFVGPDNGLLDVILSRWSLKSAVELTRTDFWRSPVSPVFHGRDIFGPVAAHCARGVDLTEFGPAIDLHTSVQNPALPVKEGPLILGTVLGSDRFGNLQTDIPAEFLDPPLEQWIVEVGGQKINGVSRFYGEKAIGGGLALIGSNQRLEIAVNQGDATLQFGVSRGAAVVVRLKK